MLSDALLSFVIALAAAGGVGIAAYVWRHKRQQKTLVCPLHANCETVIHSEFSRFFGVPVELIGLFYYGLIAISYGLWLGVPSLAQGPAVYELLILSAGAFLFSLYLTFIQVFTLRQYCSWCILSACLSTIIFLASFAALRAHLIPWLETYRIPLFVAHLLGISLGVGGAFISDIFFFKFLKDLRIAQAEDEILKTLSQVVWLGLGLLLISGIGLYLPAAEELNRSGKFLIKLLVVGIVIGNGALLNLFIAPRLLHISFGKTQGEAPRELARWRKLAFALGAVSMTSWVSVLIVSTLPRSTPAAPLIFLYGVILLGAIVISQFVERKLGSIPMLPLPIDKKKENEKGN